MSGIGDMAAAILHLSESRRLSQVLSALADVEEITVVHSAGVSGAQGERAAQRISWVPLDSAESAADTLNACLDAMKSSWVLFVDHDEIPAADLPPGLARLLDDQAAAADVFELPRFQYLGSEILRVPPYYPDPQPRFFRKGSAQFQDTRQGVRLRPGEGARVFTLPGEGNPHIHRRGWASLDQLLQERCAALCSRSGAADEAAPRFSDFITRAYEHLATAREQDARSDVQWAAATIAAWETICEGLLRWDGAGRPEKLEDAFSLPICTVNRDVATIKVIEEQMAELRKYHDELSALRSYADEHAQAASIANAELEAIKATWSWRLYASVRRLAARIFPR